jgi:hypothetical protein
MGKHYIGFGKHTAYLARGAALLACIALTPAARAAALDQVSVHSYLDQPLRAVVALNGYAPAAECVKADVRSIDGETIAKAAVRVSQSNGEPLLLLSTSEAINEPVISLFVQMVCGSHEEHNYSLMLDVSTAKRPAIAQILPAPHTAAVADANADPVSPFGLPNGGIRLSLSHDLAPEILTALSTQPADITVTQPPLPHFDMDHGMVGTMVKYRHAFPIGCAVLLGSLLLILFYASRRTYNWNDPAPTADKKELPPIPFVKPQQAIGQVTRKSERQVTAKAAVAESHDTSMLDDMDYRLPRCQAEEVADDTLLAEIWIAFNKPHRAIEVLEERWGDKEPSTPMPWRYLLQLYKVTGNLQKYRELSTRFQNVFGIKAVPAIAPVPQAKDIPSSMPYAEFEAYRLSA